MIGRKFQVSKNPIFSDTINLYEIKEKMETSYQIAPISTTKAYKYFRYLAPSKSRDTIAEIEVQEAYSNKKLYGK